MITKYLITKMFSENSHCLIWVLSQYLRRNPKTNCQNSWSCSRE